MSAPPESMDVGDLIMSSHLVHWVLTAISAVALWLTKFFFNKQLDFNDRVEKTMTQIQRDQAYMMGHLGIKREDER